MYPFSILYLLQSLERKKFVIVPRGVCFQVMQGKADCNIRSGESRKRETVHHAPPSTHRRCSRPRTQWLEDLTGIHAMNGGTKKKMVESCSIL